MALGWVISPARKQCFSSSEDLSRARAQSLEKKKKKKKLNILVKEEIFDYFSLKEKAN